jgi:hypothetical protein
MRDFKVYYSLGPTTMKRPTSVTIIAYLIIAAGAFSLVTFPAMLADRQKFMALARTRGPFAAHVVVASVGTLLLLAAGFGLLRGANWARYLYIIWGGLGIVQLLVLFQLGPQQILLFIAAAIKYAVFVYFLMRIDADNYFRGVAQA